MSAVGEKRFFTLAPVLNCPAASFGEALQGSVWVDRDGLVRPFEGGRIGRVVRVEADVAVLALEPGFLDPGGNHPQFGLAVGVLSLDPLAQALVEADHRTR